MTGMRSWRKKRGRRKPSSVARQKRSNALRWRGGGREEQHQKENGAHLGIRIESFPSTSPEIPPAWGWAVHVGDARLCALPFPTLSHSGPATKNCVNKTGREEGLRGEGWNDSLVRFYTWYFSRMRCASALRRSAVKRRSCNRQGQPTTLWVQGGGLDLPGSLGGPQRDPQRARRFMTNDAAGGVIPIGCSSLNLLLCVLTIVCNECACNRCATRR